MSAKTADDEIKIAKPITCPYCSHRTDSATLQDAAKMYELQGVKEVVAVCSQCGEILALGLEGKVRSLTATELCLLPVQVGPKVAHMSVRLRHQHNTQKGFAA